MKHPGLGALVTDREIEPAAVGVAPRLGQSPHSETVKPAVLFIVHLLVAPKAGTIGGQAVSRNRQSPEKQGMAERLVDNLGGKGQYLG